MRNATRFVLVLTCLALATAADAKGKPEPVSCPADPGLAVTETCPCSGRVLPNDTVQPWKNHGQYVSCVVRFRNALRKAGCFTDDSVRRTIARCAARSTCGKTGIVLCCFSDPGTCTDATPGDGKVEGTCLNDPETACDASEECATVHGRIAHDEASCVAAGGVNGGSGSVCGGCTTTTTTSTTTTTTATTTTLP